MAVFGRLQGRAPGAAHADLPRAARRLRARGGGR